MSYVITVKIFLKFIITSKTQNSEIGTIKKQNRKTKTTENGI